MWVQPDAGNPLRQEPSILSRRHDVLLLAPGGEKELTGPLARHPGIVVHRLTCLFSQFKPDGPTGLFLAHGCPIDGIAIRGNILDLESNHIAASQLAVDARLNIARSRVRCSIWSLVRIAQTYFCRSGGLAPISFPLFQGIRLGVGSRKFVLSCMVILLGYRGATSLPVLPKALKSCSLSGLSGLSEAYDLDRLGRK
jgi:hypothetical protein